MKSTLEQLERSMQRERITALMETLFPKAADNMTVWWWCLMAEIKYFEVAENGKK